MFSVRKEEFTNPRCLWWFLFLLAISLVLGARTLLTLCSLAWTTDAYTHILLILPISAAVICLEWPSKGLQVEPSWRAGSILLVVALLLAAFLKWESTALGTDEQLSISTLALVLWWLGSFIASFGTRLAKSFLFPLCFLFWMVPLPTSVLDTIIAWLQQGSAYAAQILFTVVGVPVTQDGVRVTIPGLTVEVAQECSSIRSSMILLVTTMVLAQLFLRSPWRKTFVIGIAIPLSVAKNGLRIFTIAMLGTRVDPAFLTGKLHHNGGVIFLSLALAVIFLLLWALRDPKSAQSEGNLRPAISSANQSDGG
ncbi:MAG TPA: exosortase/archaeosortase family protein [Terriglobales bacterium]|nr:exosortase/archaeosortase family protein [Terriglobales bacterium]